MALRDYVTGRCPELRRTAFLMCGDRGLADELTRATLARFVAGSRRAGVEDPDAFVYADLMDAFRRRPPRRLAAAQSPAGAVPVLDALRMLSWRCRAVLVLRGWTGFTVDETADVLGLTDERVTEYEAAGLAALGTLLGPASPPLAELLAEATAAEPPADDGVEAVFRRAATIRRRHLRNAVAAGVALVVLAAGAGYALTDAILPETAPTTGTSAGRSSR
jgi:DNA-directed RNA polymerase specialized sigma24 family protein